MLSLDYTYGFKTIRICRGGLRPPFSRRRRRRCGGDLNRRAGSADAFGPATPLFYIYGHGDIHCIMNPLFLTTVIILNLVIICIPFFIINLCGYIHIVFGVVASATQPSTPPLSRRRRGFACIIIIFTLYSHGYTESNTCVIVM